MKANDIRKTFLAFFESKGHTVIPSDSVVPKNDPTVLFTTAGMQQFKQQFLGHLEGYTRAATSQKCLRTDDLDKIGKTDVHHTFFEMLGNFSFGDYFKTEAITWAWEFMTKAVGIPADRLWVSVYKDDSEAEGIWLKTIKIPKERLVKLGDKSNFWPANAKENGPNGPCGPCSEIFYDYGPNPQCSNKHCNPDCDCGRFAEIWNLVFTQFNRKDGGILEPLPSKNIDTGMGLERLAAVLQGKKSNYETDLFQPILAEIKKLIGLSSPENFIVADHIRAIVFSIADGVVPSNENRGYVLKKLIIDVTDIALNAGQKKVVIHKLVPSVVDTMKSCYPELSTKMASIADVIKSVEESYIKVRKERVPELQKILKQLSSKDEQEQGQALGELIFTYRDRFGLTLTTILSLISEAGISKPIVDEAHNIFRTLMQQQQNRSRSSSKMTGDVFTDEGLKLDVAKTTFLGYDHTQSTSKVLKLYDHTGAVKRVEKGASVKVILDKTPFYAESGGQIGDSGLLKGDSGKIAVYDTQKVNDVFIHSGEVMEGFLAEQSHVQAEIDVPRRLHIMRNHSATHLLQTALREVLGPHVQQQGSLVSDDRLRFDFSHPKAVSENEVELIEKLVNSCVRQNDAIVKEVLPVEKAKKSGALAFFAEKYGQVVRVVTIGDYSKEFCGGTHLDATGQIGIFKIVTEGAVAQGIRRIEARTGEKAFEDIVRDTRLINQMTDVLKTSKETLIDRLDQQSKQIKRLERQIEALRLESIRSAVPGLIKNAESLGQAKFISSIFDDVDMPLLRKIGDLVKQQAPSSIVILGARSSGNASLIAMVSDDLVKKGVKANDLIQELAMVINGSGGGRPQLAQAGSKETVHIEKAVQTAKKIVKDKLR